MFPVKAGENSISWWNSPREVEEGGTWRDMTNGDLVKERVTRTTMLVLALLVAVGMAVAIYYCVNTTRLVDGWFPVSNAPLSAIPAVFGTIIVLALAIPAGSCISFERGELFTSKETIAKQEEKKHNLLTQNLEYVYKNYGSGYSGWGVSPGLAFLTKGILTNPQKSELFKLDRDYHLSAKIIAEYSNSPSGLMQGIGQDSGHRYTRAVDTLKILERQWTELKRAIALNPKDESTTNNQSYVNDDNL